MAGRSSRIGRHTNIEKLISFRHDVESMCVYLSFCLSRKTKYFYKGRLDWDPKSSSGRYVRENCKPFKVGHILVGVNCLPFKVGLIGQGKLLTVQGRTHLINC